MTYTPPISIALLIVVVWAGLSGPSLVVIKLLVNCSLFPVHYLDLCGTDQLSFSADPETFALVRDLSINSQQMRLWMINFFIMLQESCTYSACAEWTRNNVMMLCMKALRAVGRKTKLTVSESLHLDNVPPLLQKSGVQVLKVICTCISLSLNL